MSRIVELWRRMAAMYGHTWASQYGSQPEGAAADTWAAALASLSGQDIANGLRACVIEGREFPPSAPRFRAMCLGIPEFERVRVEVTKPEDERSPFTRLAWSHVDGYRHRHASVRDGDAMLRAGYELACDHVMAGGVLPGTAPALGPPQRSLPIGIPETREARCARLQQLLGDGFNPRVADPAYDPERINRKTVGTSAEERRKAEADLTQRDWPLIDDTDGLEAALDDWRAGQAAEL